MQYIIYTVCLLASFTVAFGATYDNLRVRFGWSSALADKEHFFVIPRTITGAQAAGWVVTERPSGPMPELQMYCPAGRALCALYAPSGFIAGLQFALPVDDYTSLPFEPSTKFIKWSPLASNDEATRDYWTLSQFFVSKEILKSGAPKVNGPTLQSDSIWVTDADKLVRMPTKESELSSTTLFNRQNCMPNMGTHYFYNMTRSSSCDLLPWFALVKDGEVIGSGFQIFGKLAAQSTRNWFENPTKKSVEMIVPNRPACLTEYTTEFGLVSIHVYYINEPWTISCTDADSLEPNSGFNAFLINAIRHGSNAVDIIKNTFG